MSGTKSTFMETLLKIAGGVERERVDAFTEEVGRVLAEKRAGEPPVSVETDDRGRVVLKIRGHGVSLSKASALRLADAIARKAEGGGT